MNTAFWVNYPLRNCLKMRKNSNMFAVIFNHSQQTWSFTDDVKSNSSSLFTILWTQIWRPCCKKCSWRFSCMANLQSCFSDSFQNGGQESKEEENLPIFRSLSALESQSGKVVIARIKRISIRLLYVTRK